MSWVCGFLCLVSINSRSDYAVQTRGKAVTLWPEVLASQFSPGHLSRRLPHKHSECVTRVTLCPVAVLWWWGSSLDRMSFGPGKAEWPLLGDPWHQLL